MEEVNANSRESWEKMFEPGGHWDQVRGSEMTRRFAEEIVNNLTLEVLGEVNGKTVMDWGCARGEGIDVFRRFWPSSMVYGIDHSLTAIRSARERKDDQSSFFWEPRGRIMAPFYTIINSNVMEHLDDPLAVLREHLRKAIHFYIILTPFEEDWDGEEEVGAEDRKKAGHTHFHRFHRGSFPADVLGEDGRMWYRVQEKVIPLEDGPWIGNQMLVVYRSS